MRHYIRLTSWWRSMFFIQQESQVGKKKLWKVSELCAHMRIVTQFDGFLPANHRFFLCVREARLLNRKDMDSMDPRNQKKLEYWAPLMTAWGPVRRVFELKELERILGVQEHNQSWSWTYSWTERGQGKWGWDPSRVEDRFVGELPQVTGTLSLWGDEKNVSTRSQPVHMKVDTTEAASVYLSFCQSVYLHVYL